MTPQNTNTLSPNPDLTSALEHNAKGIDRVQLAATIPLHSAIVEKPVVPQGHVPVDAGHIGNPGVAEAMYQDMEARAVAAAQPIEPFKPQQ